MISSHPYKLWPLHVKVFTMEASKAWNEALTKADASTLPRGFTLVNEFEGVDGKSGEVGSGRRGPIDVTDGESTPKFHPSRQKAASSD